MQLRTAFHLSVGLAAAAWLAACATPPADPMLNHCQAGKKDVTISFGDSYLKANAKTRVKPDGKLVFKLKADPEKGPNGKDYAKVKVTIRGKDEKSGWISASGTVAEKGTSWPLCVPPDQAEGTYEYIVEVAGVGMLDPRVIVEK